ncbi:MAG: hypothetical protein RR740_00040 [Pseudomonas sp.]
MSELIKVDFKKREVVSRQDLDAPVPAWTATKDPEFKEWVAGIAQMAESCHQMGGNWQQMIVIVHGKPAAGDEFCMTMFDGELLPDARAIEVLHTSATRLVENTQGESAQGGEDEPV